MTLERAKQITERLLQNFGLNTWTVHLVNFPPLPFPRRRLGLCSYADTTIYLSIEHVEHDPDACVLETVAEEVAHALTPGAAHDERWKSARALVWRVLLEDDTTPRAPLWYVRHGPNNKLGV